MRTFAIEGSGDSPHVILDEAKKLLEISGNSTLKDTNWFYTNMLKWMIAFNSGDSRTETINIRLQRINDSSAKWLTHIFRKLQYFAPDSAPEINWFANNRNNRRLIESARILKEKTGYQVNLLVH